MLLKGSYMPTALQIDFTAVEDYLIREQKGDIKHGVHRRCALRHGRRNEGSQSNHSERFYFLPDCVTRRSLPRISSRLKGSLKDPERRCFFITPTSWWAATRE